MQFNYSCLRLKKRDILCCICRPICRSVRRPSDVRSISFVCLRIVKLGTVTLESRFSSRGERSRSNCWSCTNVFRPISFNHSVWNLPNLVQYLLVESKCYLPVWICRSPCQGQTVCLRKIVVRLISLSAQYLLTQLLESCLTWYCSSP